MSGTITLYRRAGQTAQIDETPLLDPCDLDDLPPCSPRAGLLLQQILNLSYATPHLSEWLALAIRSGQRVGDKSLPRLLTAFQTHSAPPDKFYDGLGKRGRWLAQQNESWSYAVLPETDTEWELAKLPARLHYVRQLRGSDPARARALVASAWSNDKGDNRWTMLRTFEINLSMEDEPFIEAALDDRSSSVRGIATGLLAKLPASAYSQRMVERARSLIQIGWQKERLVIDLTLPQACDQVMIRDGIALEPPEGSGLGERAHWLLGIASALPLTYWLSGDWSMRDLVQAAVDHGDWSQLLLKALRQVVNNYHSYELAETLLELSKNGEHVPLNLVRPRVRETYAIFVLTTELDSANPQGHGFAILRTLCNLEHSWSSGLTQAFLKAVEEILPKLNAADVITVAGHLPAYVMWMYPSYSDGLQSLASVENKSKPTWSASVKRAAQTLEFRQKIQKEFAR